MPDAATQPVRQLHRRITERFVIEGKLRLETPAHFGNGDKDDLTDMPLLEDEFDGSPLLTGASIAGALRNYLRERELGDWAKAAKPPEYDDRDSVDERKRKRTKYLKEQGRAAALLFGAYRRDDDGRQSPLIVRDTLGQAAEYELRDGVRIEPETRTAEDEKKYDTMLLAAGSTFDLRFELLFGAPDKNELIPVEEYRPALLTALATALDGLANGEITLGARKRRGFGRCRVDQWQVRHYNLETRNGLLSWLAEDHQDWADPVTPVANADIRQALGGDIALLEDRRKRLKLAATFALDGSLMVRSGVSYEENSSADREPDMTHLHSLRADRRGERKYRPIFAGTSWAGVLRSRATQIAYTLAPHHKGRGDDDEVRKLIDGIFGPEKIESGDSQTRKITTASRVDVTETEIQGGKLLEQTRIRIDRFTGGAFESALFSEQPIFGNQNTTLNLELALRLPDDLTQRQRKAEIGLLLLLLKDLWTGDLPLGGESGIGRGRLQGIRAEVVYDELRWKLKQENGRLTIEQGDKDEMQGYVVALKEELRHARAKTAGR